MKKRYSMILMIVSVVFVATGIVKALDVIVPHVFVSGTQAKASEVNENFNTLVDAVNAKADISTVNDHVLFLTNAIGNKADIVSVNADIDSVNDQLQVMSNAISNKADTEDIVELETLLGSKLDKTGGFLTGNLTVPKVVYSTPRVHRYCISGDMFRPRVSSDAYSSGQGNGGSRIVTEGSSGTMMAQANLPDGATITEVTFHIVDNDPVNDLILQARVQFFAGAYSLLHPVTPIKTTGASATAQTISVTPTSQTLVNNASKAVVVMIYPDTTNASKWSTLFYIRGVNFTYTLPEAQ